MLTTRFTFPTAGVKAVIPEGVSVDVLSLGRGPLVAAQVFPEGVPGAIGQRVYVYADELPLLDLSTLRHRGRPAVVGAWSPVPEGAPVVGATLRASFTGPPILEVTDYLPQPVAAT